MPIKNQRKFTDAEILSELVKRKQKPDILTMAFPKQIDIIKHPNRTKALLTNRRFGKSTTAGLYLFKEALDYPGSTNIYVALTRESAQKIMYKDVLKKINKDYHLNAKFNEAPYLKVTLPNESVIYLLGLDKDKGEAEKVLGQAFRLVVVDECASFKQDLGEIINKVLIPATVDWEGTVFLIGTPGDNTRSYFYDVTTGKEKGWEVFKGLSHVDNPHMKDKMQKEINRLIEKNPLVTETSWFKQMYLGEWVIDNSKLVSKFNRSINLIDTIRETQEEFYYIMGIDLGFNDATAITVVGYRQYDRNLYVFESFKKKGMDITDVANKIKQISSKYQHVKYVVDNASKQAVEEIKNRHGIPLHPAEKIQKKEFISLMNAEFVQGYIKILEKPNKGLIDELETLIWEDETQQREHPQLDNHNHDSLLYAWRHAYNYYVETKPENISYNSEDYMNKMLDEELERLKNKTEEDSWERLFNS